MPAIRNPASPASAFSAGEKRGLYWDARTGSLRRDGRQGNGRPGRVSRTRSVA